ncbi:MAG: LPS assembly protein LptD [Acidobacteriota bacterium]
MACHGKILRRTNVFFLLLLGATAHAAPQAGGTPAAPPTAAAPVTNVVPQPPVESNAGVERPDFRVPVPRPDAPVKGDYSISARDKQVSDNGVYHLEGEVVVELYNATFKADFAEYDENTSTFKAHGHVYYRNYEQHEVLYCDSAEYNTDTERGTFRKVKGYSQSQVVARPGVLTSQEPFYFEGAYADKVEDRYILHDGFITDCAMPNPWWTLHSNQFDIIPDNRAITRKAVYRLRNIPAFYFPYFYKSLKKEPRKSGILAPNFAHSNTRGFMFATGYYWAISRSMDATYIFQDFSARGVAHHIDFRGKPTQKSDFNLIFYGVQDRGVMQGGTLVKAPGYSVTGSGRTEFANGWVARGSVNFISSLAFRQQFTESFNEAIFSETHSSASLEKNFSYYNFTTAITRTENFQDATPGNSIILRKFPEFDFNGRDRQLHDGKLPVWLSFDSSYSLNYRAQPRPEGQPLTNFYQTSQFSSRADFEPTLTTAFRWHEFHLLPSFTLHETSYGQSFQNNAVTGQHLTRSAPEFNVQFLLPSIEKIYDRKTFLGDKLKHVVEARANYKYVSNVTKFADTLRFDPIDLLSDTHEVEVGLINRLYSKKGDNVREILTWEVFQKRYFDPTFGGAVVAGQRNVLQSSLDLTGYSFLNGPRNYSPIVSILRGNPRGGIGFTWETDYDPMLHRFVNSVFSADIRVKRYFISAGSDQVRPDPVLAPPANQFRSTFGYGDPNRKGWNAAFSMVYDYRMAQLDYGVAQVTYNTDCCGLSFQIRRLNFGTRDETVPLVSFSIANIGTVGNLKKQERLF